MASGKVTFDDMAGFRVLGYNKAFLWLMGQRANAVGPTPTPVLLRRCTFGVLGCFIGLALLTASSNGVRISVAKQDLNNVAKCLVVFSTCISMIHKYFVFLSQEKGISRIGMWMKRVKTRNEEEKVHPPHVEVFLRRNIRLFYYGGQIAPWVMVILPVLHGEDYGFKFPFIDHSQKYLVIPLALASHLAVAWEVTYDASCLINMLITFRAELLRLREEWASMKHSDADETLFGKQLKNNVDKHVELLTIFKDLKNLNNSMFGYQVFAATLTTCAMIYGCSKDTKFIREATSQVLPVSSVAFIEFALLCWLGEEISSGFQQFHRAVHMTNWYEAKLEYKKSLTIMLAFSKHPKILTGFSVFKATLSTFLETMKQSFSLFTLLKAIG